MLAPFEHPGVVDELMPVRARDYDHDVCHASLCECVCLSGVHVIVSEISIGVFSDWIQSEVSEIDDSDVYSSDHQLMAERMLPLLLPPALQQIVLAASVRDAHPDWRVVGKKRNGDERKRRRRKKCATNDVLRQNHEEALLEPDPTKKSELLAALLNIAGRVLVLAIEADRGEME